MELRVCEFPNCFIEIRFLVGRSGWKVISLVELNCIEDFSVGHDLFKKLSNYCKNSRNC